MKITRYLNGEEISLEELAKVEFTSEAITRAIQAANERMQNAQADEADDDK